MEGEINQPSYTLEREISNLIKVWVSVVVSLCYCYFSAKFVPKGMLRLFSILPIVSLLLALPLKLQSANLGGNTAFFIAWLSNFKLLLFAFDKGPLAHPSLSLHHFIAIACFPIRIQPNPPTKSHRNSTKNHNGNIQESLNVKTQNKEHPSPLDGGELQPSASPVQVKILSPLDGGKSQNPPQNGENSYPKATAKGDKSIWNYALKVALLALFVRIYDYSDRIEPNIILVLYSLHIYMALEITLAMVASVARTVFGFELEPHFDEPYLSTSLQDFWGRRWNLVVSRTLRPAIYDPILRISAPVVGRKWAALPAVMITFVVSGLMHELMFYYMGRMWPTWEITWFFVLHGACLVVEIGIKKVVDYRFSLPRVIATPLTIGFVMVTSFWLFFPQLLRCKADTRSLQEYALVGAFVKDLFSSAVKYKSSIVLSWNGDLL